MGTVVDKVVVSVSGVVTPLPDPDSDLVVVKTSSVLSLVVSGSVVIFVSVVEPVSVVSSAVVIVVSVVSGISTSADAEPDSLTLVIVLSVTNAVVTVSVIASVVLSTSASGIITI